MLATKCCHDKFCPKNVLRASLPVVILVTKELAAVLHQQVWLMGNSLGLIETRKSSHSKLATALSFDAAKAPGEEKKKKKTPKNQTQPTSVRSTKHQLSASFSPAFSAHTWQNTKTVAWWAQSSCLSKPCVIQWHSASTSLAGMFQPDEITQKCEIKQQ